MRNIIIKIMLVLTACSQNMILGAQCRDENTECYHLTTSRDEGSFEAPVNKKENIRISEKNGNDTVMVGGVIDKLYLKRESFIAKVKGYEYRNDHYYGIQYNLEERLCYRWNGGEVIKGKYESIKGISNDHTATKEEPVQVTEKTLDIDDIMKEDGYDEKSPVNELHVYNIIKVVELPNNGKEVRTYYLRTEEKSILFYNCDGGKISVDTTKHPIIDNNGEEVYGYYGERDYILEIKDMVSPTIWTNQPQLFIWQVKSDSGYVAKKNNSKKDDKSKEGLSEKLNYSDVNGTNEDFYIRRQNYKSNIVSCNSNDIHMKRVPKVTLAGIKGPREYRYCHVDETKDESECLVIEGNEVDTEGDKEVYGLVYEWEMNAGEQGWTKIEDASLPSTSAKAGNVYNYTQPYHHEPYKLYIKREQLSDGVTYKFRQKVILTRFGGKIIYASDEKAEVSVRAYRAITPENFSMGAMPEICHGSTSNTAIRVKFMSDYGIEDYDFIKDGTDKGFRYEYNVTGTNVRGTKKAENLDVYFDEKVDKKLPVDVLISDNGCLKEPILLTDTVRVKELPVLAPQYVEGLNCQTTRMNGRLYIMVAQGQSTARITVSDLDENYGESRYEISVGNEGEAGVVEYGEWKSFNKTEGYSVPASTCKYVKLRKIYDGCTSEDVVCEISKCDAWVNKIGIGGDYSKECRICEGEDSPAISNEIIRGAYGEETYEYSWKYSTDGKNWVIVPDQSGRDLEKGVIQTSEKMYYVMREVVSSMGTAIISSGSDTVIVRKYDIPGLELYVNGETKDRFACYGERLQVEVRDTMSVSREGAFVTYCLCTKDKNNRYTPVTAESNEAVFSFTADRDTVLYGMARCCDEVTYSRGISISVGSDLSDFEVSYGGCRVKGDSVLVSLPTENGITYNFYYKDSLYPSSVTDMYIKLPEQVGEAVYMVRASKGGCAIERGMSIESEMMQDRPTHETLAMEAEIKDGMMCAGSDVRVLCYNDDSRNDLQVEYTWYVKGKQTNETNPVLSYVPDATGDSVVFVRERRYYAKGASRKELCATISDTTSIRTYEGVRVKAPQKNGTSFCYGDTIVLNIQKAEGGTGNGYTYTVYRVDDGLEEAQWVERLDNFSTDEKEVREAVYKDGTYIVKVSDDGCNNRLYADSMTLKDSRCIRYSVGPDYGFTLTQSCVFVEEADLADDKTKEVTFKSAEIDAMLEASSSNACKVKYVLGKDTREVSYMKGDGFTISVKRGDFDSDGVLKVSVVHGSESCNRTFDTELFYSSGFSAQPAITCEEAGDADLSVRGCRNDEVHLVVNQSMLPSYNGNAMDIDRITYQWYRLTGQSVIQLSSETGAEYVATIGDSAAYRCLLTYDAEGTGKNLKKVFSTNYTVKPVETPVVGSVYFGARGTYEKYVCSGSGSYVTLKSEVKVDKYTSMTWQASGDGKEWSDLADDDMVNGSAMSNCDVNAARWMDSKSVYFRMKVNNTECGAESYSDNVIVLKYAESPRMDKEKIRMSGDGVIREGMSLSFYNYRDGNYKYNWSYGNDESFEQSALYTIASEFKAGEDTVYVYKEDEHGCASDTLAYGFRLYDELRANWVSYGDVICPDGNTSIQLGGIQGGTGNGDDYEVEWLYRTKDMTAYSLIQEGFQSLPFTYKISKASFYSGAVQELYLSNVRENVMIRANVSCGGGYTGPSLTGLSTIELKVYEKLGENYIDVNEEKKCYGDHFTSISGVPVSGGTGKYYYQWQKSTDKVNWTDIPDQTSCSYIGYTEKEEYRLYENTYFRRIAGDLNCRSISDTSNIKTVIVMPEVKMPNNPVNYYRNVISGDPVVFQPNYDEYDYVWNRVGDIAKVDTTYGKENYGKYVSSQVFEETAYRMRVRYQDNPYCVSDWDTFSVKVIDVIPIELSFENQMNDTKRYREDGDYWICSGESAGRIISNGTNGSVKHQWMYSVNGTSWKKLYNDDETPAGGESVNTDECMQMEKSLKNVGTTSPAKWHVSFFRVDTFMASDRKITVNSDTVSVYVVPTLSLSEEVWLLKDSLAGVLVTNKNNYCVGEDPLAIKRNISDNVYEFLVGEKAGPRIYDNKRSIDSMSIRWEYNVGNGAGEWIVAKEVNITDYLGNGTFDLGEYVDSPDGRYQVRSSLDDGCSSVSSNVIRLNWSNVVADEGAVSAIAEIDEENTITRGFEIGDSIVFRYKTVEYPCYWYADKSCKEVLREDSRTCGIDLSGDNLEKLMKDPHLYLKRYDEGTGCMSTAIPVTLSFGTRSDGGRIGSSQKICAGEKFEGLLGLQEASGNYLYPVNERMKFRYHWQYTTDPDNKNWINVTTPYDVDLPQGAVDSIVSILNKDRYWFRRVAVNDSDRVSYSDTVMLGYHDVLVPGEVSVYGGGNEFCDVFDLPYVRTTRPSGGYTYNNDYSYDWQMSMNGGEYKTLFRTPLDSISLKMLELDTLDRSVTNTLSIRCVYGDRCGEVESNEVKIVLHRLNSAPEIYEDNECGADTVIVRVKTGDIKKSYTWLAYDAEGTVNWSWDDIEYKKIYRYMNDQMSVVDYGVYSVDLSTGCKSDQVYFNIDSLPPLVQGELVAPEIVCYGTSADIKGGEVTGGTGEKSYQWLYSYDDIVWEDVPNATLADYATNSMILAKYFRRVVTDKCYSDTSKSVRVDVFRKLTASAGDFEIGDHKCEGMDIRVEIKDSAMQGMSDYYEWYIFRKENTVYDSHKYETIFSGGLLDGFEGQSLDLNVVRYYEKDDLKCESEPAKVTLYNAPTVTENVISVDNPKPCNGSYIEIENAAMEIDGAGDKGTDELLSFKWYVGKDKLAWNELLLKNDMSLKLEAEDTMYVIRVVYNGCAYDTSNVVTIVGVKVDDYDYVSSLDMSIVSDMSDSSVVMNVDGGKDFGGAYVLAGDGILPDITANATVLPYKAEIYKDSVLMMSAKTDHCVRSYRVTPLRGGVISFDGDTLLCGGENIPSIVATDVEGGNGQYAYQWQYKNKYTSDYINIDGATEKVYTPDFVSVATNYRRMTYDGEYVSVSNVVKVSIRALPKAGNIYTNIPESVLDSLELTSTQYSIDKLPSKPIEILDVVTDADKVIWQRSYDNVSWETVETQDAEQVPVYALEVNDTSEMAYYRVIGISACGRDTAKPFKVNTIYASVILDEDIILYDSICQGDMFVRIELAKDNPYVYNYSYRSIGYECLKSYNPGKDAVDSTGAYGMDKSPKWFWDVVLNPDDYVEGYFGRLTDTTKVKSGAIWLYPAHSFDVEITRHTLKTGAQSKKIVHFFVDEFSAGYSYLIDGFDYHEPSQRESTVTLNQGSRVEFTPNVKSNYSDNISYKWKLLTPLNSDYYWKYGGDIGREGLTSEEQSPVCYFYNPGNYTVSMEVTDGMCSSVVTDKSMYIAQGVTRMATLPASFGIGGETPEPEYRIVSGGLTECGVMVYPNPCVDWLNVITESGNELQVVLYDTEGVELYAGNGCELKIDMRKYPQGVYLLKVDGEMYKVIRK